jgi:hypothetical protein
LEAEPDYSRAALARFIDFVVDKNLVHPATAQGWRVATSKVLEDLPAEAASDVRSLNVETTFRGFLNRNPGRLSPASVGEYRRRVGRAIEEFLRWVEDPGSYAFRGAPRGTRAEGRSRPGPTAVPGSLPRTDSVARRRIADPPAVAPPLPERDAELDIERGITLHYPLRPDLLAQVMVPRDLTVDEARRMGAFLLTLAVDFRPGLDG